MHPMQGLEIMAFKDLTGRWVLVTGAASGIGHETALAFAREGANIVAIDLDEPRVGSTAAMIESLGRRCLTYGCDVSDSEAVGTLAAKVTAAIGAPHVVVNNAGIGFLGSFLETPIGAWHRVIGVNLMGVVNISRAFLPAMIEAGDARHLVNIASAAGIHAVPNLSAYSASKHAVVGLCEALSMELERTHVCVTVVCPGIINTPIVRNHLAAAPSVPASAFDKLDRQYQARGAHPSLVAARIVRAVRRGEGLVLVGPSAALVFHTRRLSRRLLRKASMSGARQLGYVW
jgi:NAD(P)-dependent dehydrogenase (short-subunit alcohol dehydrogenase family)